MQGKDSPLRDGNFSCKNPTNRGKASKNAVIDGARNPWYAESDKRPVVIFKKEMI